MSDSSLRDRLRYWFDNAMAKGPMVLVLWLGILVALIIVSATLLVWVTSANSQSSVLEQAWAFAILALEPDAITFGPPAFRIATLAIVFTSIFVLSTLIGILTTSLDLKLSQLRRGRSNVVESDHTVVLGWSPLVFPIVEELVTANENRASASLVILGEQDKISMEEQISERIGNTSGTKVVLRRGDPLELGDLEIASLATSRSIVVLPSQGPDPDSTVIKTLLAITNSRRGRPDPYHIVAELRREQNAKVAKIVAGDEVELIQSGEFVARIIAQTCRQAGLSVVYTELMDFRGDEIYFAEEPSLVNSTYRDALSAYRDSAVIGLKSKDGIPKLNPAMDTEIGPGDKIIAVSRDDDTVLISRQPPPMPQEEKIVSSRLASPNPEQTLILGWNWKGASIIKELDKYVSKGSAVTVVSQSAIDRTKLDETLSNLDSTSVRFKIADTTDRSVLERLQLAEFDHVIVLAYSDELTVQEADAQTLVTLLHLRDLATKQGLKYSVVSEILDIRNRRLAEVSRADDFVVSDRITSLLLAQISENKMLGPVFEDLFGAEGSELYLRPANNYVVLDRPVDFYTVLEAASRNSETAIGYKLGRDADDPESTYGIVLNPDKSKELAFQSGDLIIVLAEN